MWCPHRAPASLPLTSLSSEQIVLAPPNIRMSLVPGRAWKVGRGILSFFSRLHLWGQRLEVSSIYLPSQWSLPRTLSNFQQKKTSGAYRISGCLFEMFENISCLTPGVTLFWHWPAWILMLGIYLLVSLVIVFHHLSIMFQGRGSYANHADVALKEYIASG